MDPHDLVDVVVIGGGVVGLSCAADTAARGYSTILLESHERLGEEASTHNSGVLHAGLYYPPGSLRARLCVEGRRQLVRRLRQWSVAHRIVGKMVLAMDGSQIGALERLRDNALANGVSDVRLVEPSEVLAREPFAARRPALLSPSTGVMDVGAYLRVLEAKVVEIGSVVLTGAEVTAVERETTGVAVLTSRRGGVRARCVINAGGLRADEIARLCGDDRHAVHPCRGEYATVVPKMAHVVRGLIYPLPGSLGLGVHLTKTVGDELLLGPDARYIDSRSDYESNRRPAEDFFEEAHALCPAIERDDLRLGPTGIRAKRHGPGEKQPDFFIERQTDDPRIVHLVGIESPGLTASPAIGRYVGDLVSEVLG